MHILIREFISLLHFLNDVQSNNVSTESAIGRFFLMVTLMNFKYANKAGREIGRGDIICNPDKFYDDLAGHIMDGDIGIVFASSSIALFGASYFSDNSDPELASTMTLEPQMLDPDYYRSAYALGAVGSIFHELIHVHQDVLQKKKSLIDAEDEAYLGGAAYAMSLYGSDRVRDSDRIIEEFVSSQLGTEVAYGRDGRIPLHRKSVEYRIASGFRTVNADVAEVVLSKKVLAADLTKKRRSALVKHESFGRMANLDAGVFKTQVAPLVIAKKDVSSKLNELITGYDEMFSSYVEPTRGEVFNDGAGARVAEYDSYLKLKYLYLYIIDPAEADAFYKSEIVSMASACLICYAPTANDGIAHPFFPTVEEDDDESQEE